MYKLVSNKNLVAWRNALCENDTMKLWSFQIKFELGFALVKCKSSNHECKNNFTIQ